MLPSPIETFEVLVDIAGNMEHAQSLAHYPMSMTTSEHGAVLT